MINIIANIIGVRLSGSIPAPPTPTGSALLLESASYLLLEDGSKILIE